MPRYGLVPPTPITATFPTHLTLRLHACRAALVPTRARLTPLPRYRPTGGYIPLRRYMPAGSGAWRPQLLPATAVPRCHRALPGLPYRGLLRAVLPTGHCFAAPIWFGGSCCLRLLLAHAPAATGRAVIPPPTTPPALRRYIYRHHLPSRMPTAAPHR